jgi:hypothetical protein
MSGGKTGHACFVDHLASLTAHVTRHTRAIFARVHDEEEELLQWYSKAEAIAAEVAASTQKMRAEYASKAAGYSASTATCFRAKCFCRGEGSVHKAAAQR